MLSAPLRRRAAGALAAVAGLVVLSGCAYTNPAIISEPYAAADGTNADLSLIEGGSVGLRNFVVVVDKAGGTGQVVGAVSSSAGQDLPVSIQARNPAQVPAASPTAAADPADPNQAPANAPGVLVKATSGELTQVGPEGTPFVLPGLKVGPGQYLELTASTPATGSVTWKVPVVAATSYYSGITASASPSAEPSPSTDAEETTEPSEPTEEPSPTETP